MSKLGSKLKFWLKALIFCVFNPRFLLCFSIGWMITNGWSYLLLGVGTLWEINWIIAVAGAYITFLWLPVTPEKFLTVAIAIWLMKKIFPNDEKTLGFLVQMRDRLRESFQKRKKKKEQKDST